MSGRNLIVTLNELHDAQYQIHSEKARFNVVNCGRRFGKSALAENILAEHAIDGWPCGYFAPTYKLLEGVYDELLSSLAPIVKRKHENQFIELLTGGRIDFWSLENPLAGRSKKYKVVVVDEAAFVKNLIETSWTKAIRPTLTDYRGSAWIMSTPRGKNDFFRLFNKGRNGDPGWKSWQMPTARNPYISLDEIEEARRDMPDLGFRQEYLAEFLDEGNGIFRNIVECTAPAPTKDKMTKAFIGIDIGRLNDWTVATVLNQDAKMVDQFRIRKESWEVIVDRCANFCNPYKEIAQIRIESNAGGDIFLESFQKTFGGRVYGVTVTAHNKQTMIEDLAMAFDQKALSILEIETLKTQLEDFTYKFSPITRKVSYAAPDGLHDDDVMSLAHSYGAWKEKRNYGLYV